MYDQTPIVFYDGVCGFCDKTVQFLLWADKKKRLKFAPIQGKTATQLLSEDDRNELKSIIFVKNGTCRYRSRASIQILATLGGVWKFALLGYCIPRFIRDGAYRLVAKFRYQVFGKYDSCKRPSQETLDRFLE